jgi:hypothetical protein
LVDKTSPTLHPQQLPQVGVVTKNESTSLNGEQQKGRFKIKSSAPDEKYLVKTTLGQNFVIDNGSGQTNDLVKKILTQQETIHEGKFKIKEDNRILMIQSEGEYGQNGDDDVFGDFTVRNVKSPNSLEVATGDFKITSPRKINGVNLEGKVGRFTVETISDQNLEKKKRKVSGERRKRLVSLKKSDEVTLYTLHAQISILRDQNEKQAKLLEQMIQKQDKTDLLLRDLTNEILKMSQEMRSEKVTK